MQYQNNKDQLKNILREYILNIYKDKLDNLNKLNILSELVKYIFNNYNVLEKKKLNNQNIQNISK